MSPYRKFLLCLLILILSFLFVQSTTPLPKFNIVLTTPDKTSSPTALPHVSFFLFDLFRIYDFYFNRNQYMLNILCQRMKFSGLLVRRILMKMYLRLMLSDTFS
jgi:hypothetical protein